MAGHTATGQYAHAKKDKKKKRGELHAEFVALDEDEQQIYQDLANAAKEDVLKPSNRIKRQKTMIEKIHSSIDEAHFKHGVSCYLIVRCTEDDENETVNTTFCNNITIHLL